jgi:hypothetical protein
MGYAHINNLYRDQTILMFKEIYCLEKVHGTSAHVSWRAHKGGLGFFSGAATHSKFLGLFDHEKLTQAFVSMGHEKVTVYGEAHGGKLLKMSKAYGSGLRFVAFDVMIGEYWLSVPQAEDVCNKLGIQFVHYVKVPTDLAILDAERDADSVQAQRNGMGPGHFREGVVLRPLIELTKNDGNRIICKHKRKEFMETATEREVDPEKQIVLEQAEAIALEWVTEMRLQHVLGKTDHQWTVRDTGAVVKAMIEDVNREGEGEFIPSKEADKAVGKRASKLFMTYLRGRQDDSEEEEQE